MSAVLTLHYEVAGTVADGRALVAAALHLKPDLIIADITMPTRLIAEGQTIQADRESHIGPKATHG